MLNVRSRTTPGVRRRPRCRRPVFTLCADRIGRQAAARQAYGLASDRSRQPVAWDSAFAALPKTTMSAERLTDIGMARPDRHDLEQEHEYEHEVQRTVTGSISFPDNEASYQRLSVRIAYCRWLD